MTRNTNLGTAALKKQLAKLVEAAWQYPVSISRYGSPWVWIVSHDMWIRRLGFADPVPSEHPLMRLRIHVDGVLQEHPVFARIATGNRSQVATDYLVRALILQILYATESPQQLYEQLAYNMLFRSFAGGENGQTPRSLAEFTVGMAHLLQHDDIADLVEIAFQDAPLGLIASNPDVVIERGRLQAWLSRRQTVVSKQ